MSGLFYLGAVVMVVAVALWLIKQEETSDPGRSGFFAWIKDPAPKTAKKKQKALKAWNDPQNGD